MLRLVDCTLRINRRMDCCVRNKRNNHASITYDVQAKTVSQEEYKNKHEIVPYERISDTKRHAVHQLLSVGNTGFHPHCSVIAEDGRQHRKKYHHTNTVHLAHCTTCDKHSIPNSNFFI